METKKVNRLILGIVLFHIAIEAALIWGPGWKIGIVLSFSLGELILLLPTLVYLAVQKCKTQEMEGMQESLRERLHYNKVKPVTLVYVLLFTWLSMPLTTLINAVSMLFVDNTIVGMSDLMLEMPFLEMLFLSAVLPAVVEELVFRGVIYGGYRRNGSKYLAVLLSACMFGLIHMNLNQALYAFVIGIQLALLLEATGSIWTTMLFHFTYNAQSTAIMFLVDAVIPGYYQNAAYVDLPQEQLFLSIGVYLILAVVTTPLSFCMLYKIAKNEGREEQLLECVPGRQKDKKSQITPSYVIAAVIAIAYIVFDIYLSMRL